VARGSPGQSAEQSAARADLEFGWIVHETHDEDTARKLDLAGV
jgi:hypothetical protein